VRMQFGWKEKNILSLDIQNVINRENEAYHYYDPWTRSRKQKQQLGMVPILSYTRKFL
jgi:hypothetical protein